MPLDHIGRIITGLRRTDSVASRTWILEQCTLQLDRHLAALVQLLADLGPCAASSSTCRIRARVAKMACSAVAILTQLAYLQQLMVLRTRASAGLGGFQDLVQGYVYQRTSSVMEKAQSGLMERAFVSMATPIPTLRHVISIPAWLFTLRDLACASFMCISHPWRILKIKVIGSCDM
jgi:hypothetical protein